MYTNNIQHQNILRKLLKSSLKLQLESIFSTGKPYSQIDGVTLGNPLEPNLAIFMAHLENQFIMQQDISIPVHYSRYVDDIFCVFNSLEHAKMF